MSRETQTASAKFAEQPRGSGYEGWGLYQWGNPWGVFRTKREAIQRALTSSGEPWRKTKAYFRVQRVKVRPL